MYLQIDGSVHLIESLVGDCEISSAMRLHVLQLVLGFGSDTPDNSRMILTTTEIPV